MKRPECDSTSGASVIVLDDLEMCADQRSAPQRSKRKGFVCHAF